MSLADRARRGEQLIGSFVMELPTRTAVEVLGHVGMDFAVLDLEHGPTDLGQLTHLIAAAQKTGLGAIVRLEASNLSMATRVLDMRPDGVMIPGVGDATEARSIVEACRYHPLGRRGMAPIVRHQGDFAAVDRAMLLVVQVEGRGALDEAADIAAIEGIDVVFIGPFDLSQSFGLPGQVSHPHVLDAGRSVAQGITANARLGVYATDVEAAQPWVEMGATFIAIGTDGQLLLSAARELSRRIGHAPWRRSGDGPATAIAADR